MCKGETGTQRCFCDLAASLAGAGPRMAQLFWRKRSFRYFNSDLGVAHWKAASKAFLRRVCWICPSLGLKSTIIQVIVLFLSIFDLTSKKQLTVANTCLAACFLSPARGKFSLSPCKSIRPNAWSNTNLFLVQRHHWENSCGARLSWNHGQTFFSYTSVFKVLGPLEVLTVKII